MIYNEYNNILDINIDDYFIVKFISADFELDDSFSLDEEKYLISNYPDYLSIWQKEQWDGDCLLNDKNLYLVNRKFQSDRPTYESIDKSFLLCGIICAQNDIKKILISKSIIKNDLSDFDWNKIADEIKEIFRNSDIEILVA